VEQSQPACQRIPGTGIDEAMGQLLVRTVTPLALEVALNVQSEIQQHLAEADRLRQQQVQRAQYEADRARVRYMRVDPNNRLVADTLEAQWNEQLRLLAQAKEDCEKQQRLDAAQLTEEQRIKILSLAADFPRLWQESTTSDRDRKRMARLLLEDVTLLRHELEILVQVRFKGGATQELRLAVPKSAWALRKTKPEIIHEIDHLLDERTESQIAAELNERGWHTSAERPFTMSIVHRLRHAHHLRSRPERLRGKGWLTTKQIASQIGCKPNLVKYWRQQGLLQGIRLNDKEEYLYEPPRADMVEQIKQRTRTSFASHP